MKKEELLARFDTLNDEEKKALISSFFDRNEVLESALIDKENALRNKEKIILDKDNIIIDKENIIKENKILITEQKTLIFYYEELLKLRNKEKFAKKSESALGPLFDEFELDKSMQEIEEKIENQEEITVSSYKRKKKPNLVNEDNKNIPIERIDITSDDKNLVDINSDEITKRLVVIPRQFKILEIHLHQYKKILDDGSSKIIRPNNPYINPLGKTMVSTSLVSMIITNNQISGCKQHGVQMFNKSTCGKLSRNVINNIKEHAVHITKSTANISGNTISGVPYGVFVSSDAKGKIYQNTYKSGVKKKVYVGGKTSGITPKAPKITKKSGSKTSMTVKWKKVSGAGGYEVQYSTDPKLVSGVKSVSLSAKKTSASMKKPAAGKTYYVKVLSYKKVKGMQMYSSAKAMKL